MSFGTASACLAASAGTGHAAGPIMGAPLPGLVSDEGSIVAPQSCRVTLSGEHVSVDLSIHADSPQAALLIEGPLFGSQDENKPYPDRHFPELEIHIDGAAVAPEDRFSAFMGKTDITGAIRDAGMNPWAIALDPPVTPVRPESRVLKALERLRAVQRAGDEYLAKWTARRLLRIPLQDSANQRIELRYLARPASSELQSDQLLTSERQAVYCVSPARANAMLHTGSSPRLVHVTEYSIATGIDGRPAPSVMLTKSTAAGSAAAGSAAASRVFTFACGPHGKPIAVTGNLTRRPVQVDQAANLRILEVTEP
jgi:hypothetical protein